DASENKVHRQRKAGPKAEKKKAKKEKDETLDPRQRNPRAFAFHSVNKVAKRVRRTMDIQERKKHIPVVDRAPVEPPPILIAVVGPPKVGKSTVIQCLVRNFTRHKISRVNGPVTIVSGKKRRLTIVECNNDVNSMIDLAKVADLVLLLVDASFGFEMEIFEFLNICQVHGFPKIMGVLTHLDMIKNVKALRKTKTKLKHRFWTEVYQGAKLFYLSGMVGEEYLKTEIHNLGRFISVMKFRPLAWRTTHPHLITDRFEDVTEPELIRQNPCCDRSVCLYGYVRGTHLKNHSQIHIPGCGDFAVSDASILPDPCPLPDQEKKRTLNEKERLIYAPMSGVGGIMYDKDAVYIDLQGSHHLAQQDQKSANPLVSSIIDAQETLDSKMASSQMTIMQGGQAMTSEEWQSEEMSNPREVLVEENGRSRRKAVFADEDEHEEGSGEEEEDEEEEEEDEEEGEERDVSMFENELDALLSESHEGTAPANTSEDFEFADDSDDDDDVQLFTGKKSKGKMNGMKREEADEEEGMDVEEGSDEEEEDGEEEEEEDEEEEEEESEVDEVKTPTQKKVKSESRDIMLNYNIKELKDKNDEVKGEEEEETGEESILFLLSFCLKWKENLLEKASESFLRRQKETPNLRKLVYGNVVEEEDEEDEEEQLGGLFKSGGGTEGGEKRAGAMNGTDCSKFVLHSMRDWDLEEVTECIRDCFVTGKWEADKDAETLLDKDDEMFGDFEDLETGDTFSGKQEEEEEDE
ncbi:hypothetical protein CAPTEDRAFT_82469, partial [Capitella teleta]